MLCIAPNILSNTCACTSLCAQVRMLMCAPSFLPLVRTACAYTCVYHPLIHLPVQHAHAQICTTPYWSVPSLHPHLSVQHAHAHTCVPNCTYLHTPDCPITHPTLRLLGTHISLFWGVPNCAYLHTPHCRCNHFTLLLSGTRISLFWGVSVGMERPLCGMHRTQLEVEVLQASSGICKRRQRATRNRSEP